MRTILVGGVLVVRRHACVARPGPAPELCIVSPVPVHLVQHPVVQDALMTLRDARTGAEEFRRVSTRLTMVIVADATRDLPQRPATVQTPLGAADGTRIDGDIVVVPVLRAGLGMLDPVLTLLPQARVGHLGLQRDEATAIASQYYLRLPANLERSYVLMIDPMLATGGSAAAGLEVLSRAGAADIRLVCIVAAPEGIAHVERRRAGLSIYTAAVDASLDPRKFIVPGLGDFGDRLYGTH
jgi:uracil phosphoribosyltransferase